MTYQNFTIIEDIFDDDNSGKPTPNFHSEMQKPFDGSMSRQIIENKYFVNYKFV